MAAIVPTTIVVAVIAQAIINPFLSSGLASPQSNIYPSLVHPSLKPSAKNGLYSLYDIL
jgi:hypothetical protein